MSPSKDDADFGDGTQAAAFGDALSAPIRDDHPDDFELTRVASPVKPDPTVVRELVDATMGGEHRSGGEFAEVLEVNGPHLDTTPPASPAEPIAPAPPLGMLPGQGGRSRLRTLRTPLPRRSSLRIPRLALPQTGAIRRTKPSAGSTGIILALLLLIAFLVVAIEFVSSLISSISSLFS
jgi:hypothetical protein